LLLIVLSAVVVFLGLPRTTPEFVDTFDDEGGAIELLSALFYLVGSLLCAYRLFIVKSRHDRHYLYLWGLLCFLFFGEETSWLQHIIGYGTPTAVREVNVQGEFNLHNLLDAGSWHEALSRGQFSYKLFLNTTAMFRLGFFTYFLLVPILFRAGLLQKLRNKLRFPLSTVSFVVALCATMLLSFVGYYFNQDLRMELTEAREFYYALFIMLYVLFCLGSGDTFDSDSREPSTG
jgi:hypothetical protein